MRALQLHAHDPASLRMVDGLPIPQPGRGEILLRVRAVSLNYRDLLAISGRIAAPVVLPFVPGSDAAGEVVALGDGVARWRLGDRAMTVFTPGWRTGQPTLAQRGNTLGGPLPGVLQEYVVVAEGDAVATPADLSDAEASTLPIAGVTAWAALADGDLRAGCTVVTQGSGGVALFALQFAKAAGARVIALSSSEQKLQRLRALGADVGIDYRAVPDWDRVVREATGGQGADIVIETTGSSLAQSIAAAALGGFIGVVGFTGGMTSEVPVRKLIGGLVRVHGMFVGSRERFEQMTAGLTRGGVRPVVDRVFDLSEGHAAFEWLQGGHHFGKVVIALPDR